MKYTNKFNLPLHIVDWLINDDYDHNFEENTISTTTLMKPVRAYWLSRRHNELLEMDASDLIASRMGSAIHDSMEKAPTQDIIREQRFKRSIDIDDETWTVTGKFDMLVDNHDGTWHLRDIKTTSVWTYVLGGKDEDYTKQMSVYKWLLQDEYEVSDEGYIDFVFTDWQSSKAREDDNYPKLKILPSYAVKLWSLEETEKWVKDRLQSFKSYREAEDNKLPYCTREELWASNDKYAVTKKGAKRATKLCDSEEEAKAYMQTKKLLTVATIEKRPAKVKRCKYCPALPFCNQGTYYLNNGRIDL